MNINKIPELYVFLDGMGKRFLKIPYVYDEDGNEYNCICLEDERYGELFFLSPLISNSCKSLGYMKAHLNKSQSLINPPYKFDF